MMKNEPMNRRDFLKNAAGAGIVAAITSGSVLAAAIDPNKPAEPNKPAAKAETYPQVPTRKFGRANIQIPALSFGAMFDIMENQILLHKNLQWGINYWDTAYGYNGGRSEEGIGQFLAQNPQRRKDIFIVTKASGANDSASRSQRLQESLKRMNTDYVDLYYGIHGLSDPVGLTDDVKQWAADAKAKGLIKYFGFSTHQNMASCLMAASKLDWIDGIMTCYNFRLMKDANLSAAVDACYKAGIALIAMKVQAMGSDIDNSNSMDHHFLEKGYTQGQAKIKIVLQDERICSACVTMKSVATLTSNVAAVLDKTELTQGDLDFMDSFAKQTCSSYCSGCSNICAAAVPRMPYVNDVMRSLMYHRKYGDTKLAKEVFSSVATRIGAPLGSFDYRLAEKLCPNQMPIASLVSQAEKLFA
ncbi:MAG: aldo/keto reductase [Sedimentisphaerales bacterium]